MIRLWIAGFTLIILLFTSFASSARADTHPSNADLVQAGNLLIETHNQLTTSDYETSDERCAAYQKALQLLYAYTTLRDEYEVLEDITSYRDRLEQILQNQCLDDTRPVSPGGSTGDTDAEIAVGGGGVHYMQTSVLLDAYLHMDEVEQREFWEGLAPEIQDSFASWIVRNRSTVEVLSEQVSERLERDRLVPPEVLMRGARVLAEVEPFLPDERLPAIPLMPLPEEEPASEEPADELTPELELEDSVEGVTPDLELEQPPSQFDSQIDLVPGLNNLTRCLVNRDCAAWEGRE
jgi:hypothetical protein